jgi:hypothetical protein
MGCFWNPTGTQPTHEYELKLMSYLILDYSSVPGDKNHGF